MKPIDKFILHVVYNWGNELDEAYSKSEKDVLFSINKFKEEAENFNIKITDEQLRGYIERFDQIKNNLPSDQRNINDYSLNDFIRLVTSSKGKEAAEEMDITPDVVYNENNIIIYNGSKEENCLRYGNGQTWCIAKNQGSFGNYRYSSDKKYPTFYLVKDNNLDDTDLKSFFIVVVGSDNTYKISDKTNNDVGGRATEWDRWENWSFIERHMPSVTGLKNIFKYIPLSSKEKVNQLYKKNPVGVKEWEKFPFSVKEQYLVVRKGQQMFTDIYNEEFIEKYLSKYPHISKIISTNFGIISSIILVKYLDKFSNQDANSIMANMRDKIPINQLLSSYIPFDVKMYLVEKDKWELNSNEALYVIKDKNAIVRLEFGEDVKMGIYTKNDDYPDVKINNKTSEYILGYPDLDTVPLNIILKLVSDNIIDKKTLNKIIEAAKKNPKSTLIVGDVDGTELLLDTNSLTSYKIEDDKITKISFESEEVQQLLTKTGNKKNIQEKILNILRGKKDIPVGVSTDSFKNIIEQIPYSQREMTIEESTYVVLIPEGQSKYGVIYRGINEELSSYNYYYVNPFYSVYDRKISDSRRDIDEASWKAYFNYMRSKNENYTNDNLLALLKHNVRKQLKVDFLKAEPPLSANNTLKIVTYNDEFVILNTGDSRRSFRITSLGKLGQANISPQLATRLLRQTTTTPDAEPEVEAPPVRTGRGRPAGVRNVPQADVAPIPTINDIRMSDKMVEFGLARGFSGLSRMAQRKFRGLGRIIPGPSSRGVSRRNNMLGDRGRVIETIEFGPTSVYIIRRANGSIIASINIQPGNDHYIITSNNSYLLNGTDDIRRALQNPDLAEIRRYVVQEYIELNPTHSDEIRSIIKQHIEETKKA